MADIFDQLASGQQPQAASPGQTQPSAPATAQQPAQGMTGDIFDQLSAGASPNAVQENQPASVSNTTQPPAAPAMYATPGSMPGDPVAAKLSNWAQSVASDLRHGTTTTTLGALLHRLGAAGLDSGVAPGVGEFMGSLPLGLLRTTQGGAELAQPGQRWQGTKDAVGGALDASTIPGGFIAPEAGELAGTAGDAVLTQTQRAAKATRNAIREPFSLQAVQDALANSHADIQKALETGTQAIQDDWHQTVRDIFDGAAKDADVVPDKAASLHDVAANLSDAIKAKAQGLYKQADNAVGGTRFQSFQDAVKNIKRTIREEVGLDPERDKVLQQRLADAEAGHEAAKEQLAAKGIDPGIIDNADALYRKAMALADVSKPMQASITGLRADLQNGASAMMESLSPAKLAARVNKLYDAGRLQQALGEGGSADFLTAIEETKQRLKDLASGAKQQAEAAQARAAQQTSAVKTRRAVAGTAAGAALGGIPGYALLKHLLGQ